MRTFMMTKKNRMIHYNRTIPLARQLFSLSGLLLLLALAGCRDSVFERDGVDPSGGTCPSVTEGQEQEVQMPYLLPSAETMKPGTRALSVDDESTLDLDKTHLLVFDDQDKLLYEAKITGVEPTPTDHQAGTISARLKKTTEPVSLVLYANVEGTWTTPAPGTKKVDVANSLTFTVPAGKAWAVRGRLPMWGEANKVTLDFANPASILGSNKTLHLIRSVARIDVGLNLTALTNNGAKDKDFDERAQVLKGKDESGNEVTYILKSVALYRASDKGFIAPTDVKTGSDGYSALTRTPALPTDVSAVDHTLSDVSDNIVKRSLYVPETANPQDKEVELSARPRLVVGLGRSDWGNKVTYYPIDFLTKGGTKGVFSYLHLLRNVRYKVSLLGVSGPGFDKPEDALEAAATRLRYEVISFAESDMGKVAYDGPYTLSVDEDLIETGRYGTLRQIPIRTTWPEGWSVEFPDKVIDKATGKPTEETNTIKEWLTLDRSTVAGQSVTNMDRLSFHIQPLQPGATEGRRGSLFIRAGRMRWLVEVRQSSVENLQISLFSDPEAKVPLQFIELSQLGLKAKSVDEQGKPLSLPGYRRFYVQTDPYFDPNESADFIPRLTHKGGDHFLFYNYGETNYKSSTYDVAKNDPTSLTISRLTDSYSSAWVDPSSEGISGARFFRYTGKNNVWECIVTALPLHPNKSEDDPDFFEQKTNTYLTHLEKGDKRVYAELVIRQTEYNAVPFFDKELTRPMIAPDTTAFYVMDGSTYPIYFSANADYKVALKSKAADEGQGDVIDSFDEVDEKSPSRKGKPHSFTAPNDMTEQTRFHGFATFTVSSPEGLFEPYDFTIELASAIIQPEANTYLIKKDCKLGILIPCSQVNTAARYYNLLVDYDMEHDPSNPNKARNTLDEQKKMFIGNITDIHLNYLDADDPYEPWLIWTDMGAPKVVNQETSEVDLHPGGIARLRKYVTKEGKQYIYVASSGIKAGSALIGIRSGKINGFPNLWSWHIWIVDEYPEVIQTAKRGRKTVESLRVLNCRLGAEITHTKQYTGYSWNARNFGYSYQWGRKDPFPFITRVREEFLSSGNYVQKFWDGQGKVYDFGLNQYGTKGNRGFQSTVEGAPMSFTMKESIEKPEVIVAHESVWMTEHMPFNNSPEDVLYPRATFRWVWEMPQRDLASGRQVILNNASSMKGKGWKTPFDPSPYGLRLPNKVELDCLRFNMYYYDDPEWKGLFVNAISSGTRWGDLNVRSADAEKAGIREIILAGREFTAHPEWRVLTNLPSMYAGSYVRNSEASNIGWADASVDQINFRRSTAFGIIPVADIDAYEGNPTVATDQWVYDHIYKYWPGYKKP